MQSCLPSPELVNVVARHLFDTIRNKDGIAAGRPLVPILWASMLVLVVLRSSVLQVIRWRETFAEALAIWRLLLCYLSYVVSFDNPKRPAFLISC